MPTQASPEPSAPQASDSPSGPTNFPQHRSAWNPNVGRHGFLASDGTPIDVVPLQPPSSEPTPQQMGTSFGTTGHTMPNQGFTFDPSNMETMGAIVKEALRQMGVSDVTATKTRKRSTRAAKSNGIKDQQASMSREADTTWKVFW